MLEGVIENVRVWGSDNFGWERAGAGRDVRGGGIFQKLLKKQLDGAFAVG